MSDFDEFGKRLDLERDRSGARSVEQQTRVERLRPYPGQGHPPRRYRCEFCGGPSDLPQVCRSCGEDV